ncbi:hypothetical protein B598_0881 [Chlamydia psittaci GR9]|nr:hypothetical protein B598_0881 [Chlamydia psittaci GR9]AFS26224.1 hypothetical protein B603_0885 [Chlamydia psittaci WC]
MYLGLRKVAIDRNLSGHFFLLQASLNFLKIPNDTKRISP